MINIVDQIEFKMNPQIKFKPYFKQSLTQQHIMPKQAMNKNYELFQMSYSIFQQSSHQSPLNMNQSSNKLDVNNSNQKYLILYFVGQTLKKQEGSVYTEYYTFDFKTKKWMINQTILPYKKIEINIIKMFNIGPQIYLLVSYQYYRCSVGLNLLKYNTNIKQWQIIKESQTIINQHFPNTPIQNQPINAIKYSDQYLFVFMPRTFRKEIKLQNSKTSITLKRIFVYELISYKCYDCTQDIQMNQCKIINGCSIKGRLFILYNQINNNATKIIEVQSQSLTKNSQPKFISQDCQITDQGPSIKNKAQIMQIDKTMMLVIIPQTDQFWMFDLASQFWLKIQTPANKPQIYCSNTQNHQVIGLNYEMNQILVCDLNASTNSTQVFRKRFPNPSKCQICYEYRINKNPQMQPGFKLSQSLLDNLVAQIDFPFHAFALLTDNALNFSASYFCVNYCKNIVYASKNPLLLGPCFYIQDDSKLNMLNEQLEQFLVNFEGYANYNFASVEKRLRYTMQKQSIKKQFGLNIKLASFRLGKCALYISINQNLQARIAYFAIQQGQCVCYYYVYDIKQQRTTEGYSDQIRIYIQTNFSQLLHQAYGEYKHPFPKYPNWKNCLWILSPRKIKPFCSKQSSKQVNQLKYQLTPDKQKNDIIYIPDEYVFSQISKKCPLFRALDISLQRFFKHLYLKNEHTKLLICVEGQMKKQLDLRNKYQLSLAQSYDKLSNICSSDYQKIRPMNSLNISKMFIEYQPKVVQLYFNPFLNVEHIFYPGVLFYHKNRLIRRHQVPFGSILPYFNDNITDLGVNGLFKMYGLIELPDSMDTNMFKNDFIHSLMIEKLESRCNFVYDWIISHLMPVSKNMMILKKSEKHKQIIIQDEDDERELQQYEKQPQKKVKLDSQL